MEAVRWRAAALLGATALAITACGERAATSQPAEATTTAQPAVTFDKAGMEALSKRVDSLEEQAKYAELIEQMSSVAYLKPADKGYSILKLDVGYVTVSLEDVTEYANGSKVRLRFGNPTTATLTGFSADLDWGKLDADGSPMAGESKSEKFTEDLPAGSWKNYEITLGNVSPKDLGYVRVKQVQHDGMQLRTAN